MHFSVLFLCSLPPKNSAKLQKNQREKNQNLVGTGVLDGPQKAKNLREIAKKTAREKPKSCRDRRPRRSEKSKKIASKLRKNRTREKPKIRSQDFSQKRKNEDPKIEKMPKNRAIRRFLGTFAHVHGFETIKYDTSLISRGEFCVAKNNIKGEISK